LLNKEDHRVGTIQNTYCAKEQIELKTSCSSLLQGFQQCFGVKLCSQMEKRELELKDENLTIELILPKNEDKCFQNCSRSTG
jgi:hypothetical protein